MQRTVTVEAGRADLGEDDGTPGLPGEKNKLKKIKGDTLIIPGLDNVPGAGGGEAGQEGGHTNLVGDHCGPHHCLCLSLLSVGLEQIY